MSWWQQPHNTHLAQAPLAATCSKPTRLFPAAQVMDNSEIHVVPNILMVVGLAAIGTNWFAGRICQDSLDPERFPRWKNLLLAWFAVAVLLCSLLVSAMALSYALQGHLEESLKVRVRVRVRACVRACACACGRGGDVRKVLLGRAP